MSSQYTEAERFRGSILDGFIMLTSLGILGYESILKTPNLIPRYVPEEARENHIQEYGPFTHYEGKIVWHLWGLIGLVNHLRGKKISKQSK